MRLRVSRPKTGNRCRWGPIGSSCGYVCTETGTYKYSLGHGHARTDRDTGANAYSNTGADLHTGSDLDPYS